MSEPTKPSIERLHEDAQWLYEQGRGCCWAREGRGDE